MIRKIAFFFLSFVFLLLSYPSKIHADLGPKPTIDVYVSYKNQKIPDMEFSAKVLACTRKTEQAFNERSFGDNIIPQFRISIKDEKKNCYWEPSLLTWGGDCSNSHCSFGYMPPDELKLVVYLPSVNETFISNEILRKDFNSYFNAELSSGGTAKLSYRTFGATLNKFPDFLLSLTITLAVELLITLVFLKIKKIPTRLLLYVFLANIVSLPIVTFIFPLLEMKIVSLIILSELFAVIFESLFLCKIGRILTIKQAVFLSIVNNLFSFTIGSVIMILILMPFSFLI